MTPNADASPRKRVRRRPSRAVAPGFDRIVVPLDGSALAERVLAHLERLVRRDGELVLLRAIPSVAELAGTATGVTAPGVIDIDALFQETRREALAYLDRTATALSAIGLRTRSLVEIGSPADSIVQVARQIEADLVAMTTHGRGGLARAVFGSVADAVVRQAPTPIFLLQIREDEVQPSGR